MLHGGGRDVAHHRSVARRARDGGARGARHAEVLVPWWTGGLSREDAHLKLFTRLKVLGSRREFVIRYCNVYDVSKPRQTSNLKFSLKTVYALYFIPYPQYLLGWNVAVTVSVFPRPTVTHTFAVFFSMSKALPL